MNRYNGRRIIVCSGIWVWNQTPAIWQNHLTRLYQCLKTNKRFNLQQFNSIQHHSLSHKWSWFLATIMLQIYLWYHILLRIPSFMELSSSFDQLLHNINTFITYSYIWFAPTCFNVNTSSSVIWLSDEQRNNDSNPLYSMANTSNHTTQFHNSSVDTRHAQP